MLAFSRAKGIGSSAQVDSFTFLMTSSTSYCVTPENCRGSGQSQTVGRQSGWA
jgi:hypothetical protein